MLPSTPKSVTCTAPVNIAVIKYWGKREEKVILPLNSSISVTLHQAQLCTKTTVATSKHFTEDKMWLNGKEQSMATERIQNILKEIRRRARKREHEDTETTEMINWKLHICTENNFPTAAGLASSAAGYACFAFSLAKLFGIEGEISSIARLGSGSACRSVYGGFVMWDMGSSPNGTDSIAHQILDDSSWPQLRILIVVVTDQKKQTGSSDGMQRSVETSELFMKRIEHIPQIVKKMKQAILEKDFKTFAEMTMRDSNQLHAVCLDTYPPLFYLNDTSKQIIQLVHHYNKVSGDIKVAYTFDAGPNACLFLMEEELENVLATLTHFFPQSDNSPLTYIRGLCPEKVTDASIELIRNIPIEIQKGAVQYIVSTKPGPGPCVMQNEDESLLNDSGMPKDL